MLGFPLPVPLRIAGDSGHSHRRRLRVLDRKRSPEPNWAALVRAVVSGPEPAGESGVLVWLCDRLTRQMVAMRFARVR
jgi:hypothetical protein